MDMHILWSCLCFKEAEPETSQFLRCSKWCHTPSTSRYLIITWQTLFNTVFMNSLPSYCRYVMILQGLTQHNLSRLPLLHQPIPLQRTQLIQYNSHPILLILYNLHPLIPLIQINHLIHRHHPILMPLPLMPQALTQSNHSNHRIPLYFWFCYFTKQLHVVMLYCTCDL